MQINLRSIVLLVVVAIGAYAIFAGAFINKTVQMEMSCASTGRNSMQCSIANKSQNAGEVCFDIVQICGSGEHTAHVCSGRVEGASTESKVAPAFTPPVGLFESCQGTELRNKQLKVL